MTADRAGRTKSASANNVTTDLKQDISKKVDGRRNKATRCKIWVSGGPAESGRRQRLAGEVLTEAEVKRVQWEQVALRKSAVEVRASEVSLSTVVVPRSKA